MLDTFDTSSWLTDFKLRTYHGFALTDPRAQAKIVNVTSDRRLVVDDPALRWARSWRQLGRQLIDIIKHEFWCSQGKPHRSPGARWQ